MKEGTARAGIAVVVTVACLLGGWRLAARSETLKGASIVVKKSARTLELYSAGKLVHRYKVALGLNPVDDKVREGDRCTPEGEFYVSRKNPKSQFHMSLGISYPNPAAAERGKKSGLISAAEYREIVSANRRHATPPQHTKLGGEILIHGGGTGRDWTWGCVALDNADIEELFRLVPIGTPVRIEH